MSGDIDVATVEDSAEEDDTNSTAMPSSESSEEEIESVRMNSLLLPEFHNMYDIRQKVELHYIFRYW